MTTKRIYPKSVCIMAAYQAMEYMGRKIHRCGSRGGTHCHLKREQALQLIAQGQLEWAIKDLIAVAVRPMEWVHAKGSAGRGNAKVSNLQMKPGGMKLEARFVRGGLASPK
jgi:hypothetical protein